MAKRYKQPLVLALFTISIAVILALTNFTSDLHQPIFFIFKALLQPITFVVLVCMTLYAIYKRQKALMIAVVIAYLLNIPFLLPKLAQEKNTEVVNQANSLKVATFSTLTRTDNIDDIIEFIRVENPDLFCLQEVNQQHRQKLLNDLSNHYPFTIYNKNNQITLSRYPLSSLKDEGQFQVGLLNHNSYGKVEVINAHMQRPYLSTGVSNTWQSLLEHLKSKSKVILCGDLNTTPNNSLYDTLRYRYQLNDALTSGYGFTYPNAQRRTAIFGPLVRIDYILTRGMIASETRTLNLSNLSDHRAIITNLKLTRPRTNEY